MYGQRNYNNNNGGGYNRGARPNSILKRGTKKVDKKTGDEVNAYRGYIEVGGKLIQLDISNVSKEKQKGDREQIWIKATDLGKAGQRQQRNGGL